MLGIGGFKMADTTTICQRSWLWYCLSGSGVKKMEKYSPDLFLLTDEKSIFFKEKEKASGITDTATTWR